MIVISSLLTATTTTTTPLADHYDELNRTAVAQSPSPTGPAGSTVLLGEGLVGRCAQQRCVQVYRQGVISDGTYSQSRLYCSMNIPVPDHSFDVTGN